MSSEALAGLAPGRVLSAVTQTEAGSWESLVLTTIREVVLVLRDLCSRHGSFFLAKRRLARGMRSWAARGPFLTPLERMDLWSTGDQAIVQAGGA